MRITDRSRLIQYAFFTAVATTIYVVESMAVRAIPLPFLRIGFANVITLYLLLRGEVGFALVVTVLKTLIGGLLSFTLMSPATVLSLCGGIGSLLIMWLMRVSHIRFSVIGISVMGAVVHNVIQIVCVRWIIIQRDAVFHLIPLLMLLGMVTGVITGIIAAELSVRLEGKEICEDNASRNTAKNIEND